MKNITDYSIAVADAIRLNDCYNDLSTAFVNWSVVGSDCGHYYNNTQASADKVDWVRRLNSRRIAASLIRAAILDKLLPIWIRLANSDELADANAITIITNKTLSTGVYLTHNYPKTFLEGRPLWIKQVEWNLFKAAAICDRFGNENGSNGKPSAVANILAIWRDEAHVEFAVERDNVNSTFAKANRLQSPNHIKGLAEVAGKSVKAMVHKANILPLPDGEWAKLEKLAFSVLDELADQIREIAIGANGRAPQPENGAETDRWMQPTRKSIIQEFVKINCARQLLADTGSMDGDTLPGAFVTAAREPPMYRLKGNGDFISSTDLTPTSSRKGRTKGTGYQQADAPLLKKMSEAIARDPALNATSAAKIFAKEAAGASYDAIVDRLSRAFRAGRNGE